jgi:hypothetical protein
MGVTRVLAASGTLALLAGVVLAGVASADAVPGTDSEPVPTRGSAGTAAVRVVPVEGTAVPTHGAAVASRDSVVRLHGTVTLAAAVASTDVKDCYYRGGYRGCSYFDADPDPELFTVCDDMPHDGRYVKGHVIIGGVALELGPITSGCVSTSLDWQEGWRYGVQTGIQGFGWTAVEYGYA